MKLSRSFGLGLAALVAVTLGSAAAFAGGQFQNLPVVGGASFCALFAGDGVTCVENVPAGPSALTGNELVPADTGLPNGNQSQTVRVPMVAIGAGASIFATPVTGATIAATAKTSNIVVNPAGTIAALTVTLPAASTLTEGQVLRVGSSQAITAITFTGGTGTSVVAGVPAVVTGGGGVALIYHASNATNGTWFRLD